MAASTTFLNGMLDSGVAGIIGLHTGVQVALYSGAAEITTHGISQQLITGGFGAATAETKTATNRVSFTATRGLSYDEIRLFTSGGGTELHSVTVSPTESISAGNTHQISIIFTGS